MADGKFKPGDIVYHKSTGEKGVISEDVGGDTVDSWFIVWEDSKDQKATIHTEAELSTEEEHKKQNPPANQEGSGFMAA